MDVETLIENVKLHPFLFDVNHPEYKNKRKKNEVWDAIAVVLSSNSNGVELKSKWKNLRDNYAKYLRWQKKPRGQTANLLNRYKAWPWASHMEFLKPYISASRTESDSQDIQTNDEENMPERIGTAVDDDEPEQKPAISRFFQLNPHEATSAKSTDEFSENNQKRKPPPLNDEPASLGKRVRIENLTTEFDDVDFIFLGYAKVIKKFSARRRAWTKYKIAQIILEAELEQGQEDYSHQRGASGAASPSAESSTNLFENDSEPSSSAPLDIKPGEDIVSIYDQFK
ncbi:uncharacterized protein LOC123686145 [Harmonia axyridis]|uniref:uncharacterized protein LOC123686145 n=1 Tax=Harmonia axyridis TaxID=115357 RepID=UPI001E27958A|nr:uncharacterized protein LOC123686145 [Harmonia axyridis]